MEADGFVVDPDSPKKGPSGFLLQMITCLWASLLGQKGKCFLWLWPTSELSFPGPTVQNMVDEKLASNCLCVRTECSFSSLQTLHFPGKELSLKVGQTHSSPNLVLAHLSSSPWVIVVPAITLTVLWHTSIALNAYLRTLWRPSFLWETEPLWVRETIHPSASLQELLMYAHDLT